MSLLVLVIGTVLFSRNFSNIHITLFSIPIYVTEIVLLIFIIKHTLRGIYFRKVSLIYPKCISLELKVMAILFIYSIVWGLAHYSDMVMILRHAAMYYYMLFLFIIPLELNTIKKIETVLEMYLIATIVVLVGPYVKINFFGLARFNYFYIALSFLMLVSLIYSGAIKKKIIYEILIGLFAIELVLSQVRAIWMGILAAILFVTVLSNHFAIALKIFSNIFKRAIAFIVIFLSLFSVINNDVIIEIGQEVLSIVMASKEHDDSSNNAKWRLYVWKDIIEETAEKPVFGWGFGKKFVPKTIAKLGWGGSWRDPSAGNPEAKGIQDPHNSFLSILHRTGVVGLVVMVSLFIKFIVTMANGLLRIRDNKIKSYIFGLLLCIICILFTSSFMVVLEGPYMGILLWIGMGIIVSLNRISMHSAQRENV